MSGLIGALRVTLGLDSAAFEKGASSVEKRAKGLTRTIEAHGKSMTNLGKTMSVAVSAPLVAFGVKSVQAAMESRDAMGQVEAALASMGSAAGRTSEQLGAMAGNLMHNSLYDDDDILRKVTANLLTFGNVAGEQFDRAQRAAVDLAARMGMDLQAATLLVGKALNDPVKGMGALRKAGIQLTDQQKKQVEAMVAVGDAAGAQKILLAELEKQFGGSAAAAQKANPFDTLKDSMADFMENVGGKLLDVLPNITAAITRVLDAFGSLSPGMQQAVVMGGVLAAALGPVLTVLGTLTSAMAPFLSVLGVAFAEGGILVAAKAALAGLAAAFGPVLLPIAAFAAAGALIYANWDKIGPVVSDLWDKLSAALGPPLQDILATLTSTLTELWNGPLGTAITAVISSFIDFQMAYLKAVGPAFIAILKGAATVVAEVFGIIGDAIKLVSRLFAGDWAGAFELAQSVIHRLWNVINTVFGGIPGYVVGVMSDLYSGIKLYLQDKLGAVLNWVGDKLGVMKGLFFDLYDAVVGHSYIPDMVDGIAAHMLRLDGVMVDKAKDATTKTKEAFRKLAEELRPLMAELFPEAQALNEYRAKQTTLDKARQSKDPNTHLSQEQYDDAQRRLHLLGAGMDPTSKVGPSAIGEITAGPIVQDIDKINDAVDRMQQGMATKGAGIGVATVRIAKSFKDMANETLGALQNLAGAIKGGGFLDILSSVINLGLQLGGVGAFGKSVQTRINTNIPGYANGTDFHPGGWAKVGERGPELVELPRGSAVHPHGAAGRNGDTYNTFRGNLLTPEWWQQINAGHAMAAQAGGEIGFRKVAVSGKRRLA